MRMSKEEWYGGGFRGTAPPIEHGKGDSHAVKDLWCSIWYTRFIGSEEECEEWAKKEQKRYYGGLDLKIVPIKSEVKYVSLKKHYGRTELRRLERMVATCERRKAECTEECDAFHVCTK